MWTIFEKVGKNEKFADFPGKLPKGAMFDDTPEYDGDIKLKKYVTL